MNVREMIKALQDKGMNIEFKERADRGVRITKIDNMKFKSSTSEGNVKAREILGLQLSERRAYQLKKISQEGNKPKKNDIIPNTLSKQIKRVQRLLRKKGVKKGTATKRQLRYVIKTYGIREAQRRLNQAERYAKGVVYAENLHAFRNRLINDNAVVNSALITNAIAKIDYILNLDEGINFKETDFQELISLYYDMVESKISPEVFANILNNVLNKYIKKHDTQNK